MYGSTTFFILVLDKPVPDPRTWTTASAFAGQYALAAGMSTTGSLTRWLRDELAKDLPEESAYQTLFEGAHKVPPGSEGLLLLPYFSGERTPINDPKAKGVIAGLTLSHTRDHLFRAALEGVGFGIRHNIDTFRETGAPIKRIIAVGGGTKNDTWTQLASDIAGVPQLVPKETIGASYGDAFLAGLASATVERGALDGWVDTLRTIVPNALSHPTYDSLFADFKALYKITRDIIHRLS